VIGAAASVVGTGAALPAPAQVVTPTIPAASSTTTTASAPPGPDVRVRPIPRENDVGAAGSFPVGQQLVRIEVINATPSAAVNQQLVVRFPAAPATVTQGVVGQVTALPPVGEQIPASPVGLIDARTNVWFHTVSSVPANSVVTFTILWSMPCGGRWSIAARVAERRTVVDPVFRGASDVRCGPDEEEARRPGTFTDLPWPPGTALTATTSTTSTTSTTTVPVAVGGDLLTTTSAVAATVQTSTSTSTTTTTRPRATRSVVVCRTVRKRRECRTVSTAAAARTATTPTGRGATSTTRRP
jgi:hypothetical protein